MKTKTIAETQKTRRLLLFLPLLVLPFVTMAFWSLGGGKAKNHQPPATLQGFNTALPQPKFDDGEKQDKLSVYEALSKSAFGKEQLENPFSTIEMNAYNSKTDNEITEKLERLSSSLNEQTEHRDFVNYHSGANPSIRSENHEVKKLENMMAMFSGQEDDPEMRQLDGILEKIMDIQHPGRTREKRENSMRTGAYTVSVLNAGKDALPNEAIRAAIHQDQEIVSGAVIKLRLLDSIAINGMIIPKNQFIFGLANVNGERLQINLQTIRYKNSILPVSLSAFDLDGLQGLFIPGAVARDASKEGVDDAIQSMQIITMDPSISAQAAGAGVQAIKGLFSKKVKQIRVKLKAGYQILFKDNNQNKI